VLSRALFAPEGCRASKYALFLKAKYHFCRIPPYCFQSSGTAFPPFLTLEQAKISAKSGSAEIPDEMGIF